MLKKCIKYAVICLVLIFMYVPILILAVYSFTDAPNIGPIHGFSLQNYITLFTTEELRDMITGSIMLALGSAVLATILGTTGAIGAFYSGKRVKSTISVLNQVPVVNADVVTGFSLCILLVVVFGISKDTYLPLVAGHVVLSAPFVYLAVMPKLKQMDPSLYEAALDLGATPFYALIHVIIPQLASGILSVKHSLTCFLLERMVHQIPFVSRINQWKKNKKRPGIITGALPFRYRNERKPKLAT